MEDNLNLKGNERRTQFLCNDHTSILGNAGLAILYLLLSLAQRSASLLSQPNSNSTQVGSDKVMGWPTV